jgi:hypothetical protein
VLVVEFDRKVDQRPRKTRNGYVIGCAPVGSPERSAPVHDEAWRVATMAGRDRDMYRLPLLHGRDPLETVQSRSAQVRHHGLFASPKARGDEPLMPRLGGASRSIDAGEHPDPDAARHSACSSARRNACVDRLLSREYPTLGIRQGSKASFCTFFTTTSDSLGAATQKRSPSCVVLLSHLTSVYHIIDGRAQERCAGPQLTPEWQNLQTGMVLVLTRCASGFAVSPSFTRQKSACPFPCSSRFAIFPCASTSL